MERGKRIFRVITVLVAVVTLLCAVWIMVRRLGLVDGLDFGAGAYYYADIPEYEKVIPDKGYSTAVPLWVHILIFLGWGWLVWRLWVWMDMKNKNNEE